MSRVLSSNLLDRIAEDLAARVRTLPSGAKSLGHVRVVVPTAQSGRRVRRRLAEKLGALVPPEVTTPLGLRLDLDDPTLATRTDVIAAFREALGKNDLAYAKELADLRVLLEPKALTFAAVGEAIAVDLPDEAERWRDLAAIEEKYLAALANRGKRDRIAAILTPKVSSPESRALPQDAIEETIDFSDPTVWTERLPTCDMRRPGLVGRWQIVPCATPADEAARIADDFAAVKPDEALPALCVADPEFFPEIESAFKARGLKIHNPAEIPLATSSLGHLVDQIVALLRSPSYSVFSAFIRGGDVRRWLKRELNLEDSDLTAALVDLDNRQAEFLPEKIDDIALKTKGTLRSIFEFVKVQLRKKSLRQILGAIFKDLILDERDPGAREFAAAAEAVSQLIAECETWSKRGRDTLVASEQETSHRSFDAELFALRLEEATYSLEPDEGEIILTDGWMELPFLEADELVIAGFREGCVPESTVGHPYLPDSLRHRLGLPDNAFKEARDRAILRLAVSTCAPECVTVFFHAIDAKGDVLKPSRLLFETDDDADLVARVKAFYGMKAGTAEGAATDLPANWKLALPIPPPHRELVKISPTRLDSYLRCPFTFYLKDKSILGDKRLDDRAEELASWEYGNLAHEALEAFGGSELKDSTDPAAIRAFLEEKVDAQLVDRFGTAIPAIVAMQGESVKRRLANFAEIQAKRRAAGWQIVACERKLEIEYTVPSLSSATGVVTAHPVRLYGKCDRIDYNAATNTWCVIDYKTWDSAAKAKSFETKKDGTKVWKSLQLPLYCAMLDVDASEEFAAAKLETIEACYCVLGKTKDDVVFTEPMNGGYVPEAEALVRELIAKIERGIFWPPAVTSEWQYDYADWLAPRPEESVSEAWIEDQLARVQAEGEGCEVRGEKESSDGK